MVFSQSMVMRVPSAKPIPARKPQSRSVSEQSKTLRGISVPVKGTSPKMG